MLLPSAASPLMHDCVVKFVSPGWPPVLSLPPPLSQGDGGKICLEGTVCEEYYRVRQLLYEQFAII